MAVGIGKLGRPLGGYLSFLALVAGTGFIGLAAFYSMFSSVPLANLNALRANLYVGALSISLAHLDEINAGVFCWLLSLILFRTISRAFYSCFDLVGFWLVALAALWMGFALFSIPIGSVDEKTASYFCWALSYLVLLGNDHSLRALRDVPTAAAIFALFSAASAFLMTLFWSFELFSGPLSVGRMVAPLGTGLDPYLALLFLGAFELCWHVRIHISWAHRGHAGRVWVPDLRSGSVAIVACWFLACVVFGVPIRGLHEFQIGMFALGVSLIMARVEYFRKIPVLV